VPRHPDARRRRSSRRRACARRSNRRRACARWSSRRRACARWSSQRRAVRRTARCATRRAEATGHAFSTSGAHGRSTPSVPKPRNAEPTAGKPAPVNSTHAIQTKLAFLPDLYCIYRSLFIWVVRNWRSQLTVRKHFQRPCSPTSSLVTDSLGHSLGAPLAEQGRFSTSSAHWWREDLQSQLVRGIGPSSPTGTDD
jgi:hypothetical protein